MLDMAVNTKYNVYNNTLFRENVTFLEIILTFTINQNY